MTPTRFAQTLALTLALQPLALAVADTLELSDDKRQSLGLTLYQSNLALVEDTRSLPKLPNNSSVVLTGVSSQMLPETLQVSGAGKILEQNLERNTLNLSRLLQASIGQEIKLKRFNPVSGGEQIQAVRLLAIQGQVLMVENSNQRIETLTLHDGQWRLVMERPDQMLLQPSLSFTTAGTQNSGQTSLRYLTRGLSWSMDYVLQLDTKGERLDLEGLATLSNETDMVWPDARVKLLAGEVQEPQPAFRMESKALGMAMAARADMPSNTSPSGVQDYHLYSLETNLTLEPQQQKQVPLINQTQLPATIQYQVHIPVTMHQQQPVEGINPDIQLSFEAPTAGKDRTPLPAGLVRVFRPDVEGQPQFVGGSQLSATAPGDNAEIILGKAFDLEAGYTQSEFKKLFDGYEAKYSVQLENRSEESKPFVITAVLPRPFELIAADWKPDTQTASTLKWTQELKAGESRTLNFNIKLLKP